MQICPRCNKKFSDEYSLCSGCNGDLASLEEQNEVPDLAVLCTVLDEAKAHIMRGFLENEGVPCQLENISFHAEPAPVADLMQVRLWTLREDLERARLLLEEREAIQICSACGEEVEGKDEVCQQCGERLEKR
jgi:predicted amidophosphoribosyltransferase